MGRKRRTLAGAFGAAAGAVALALGLMLPAASAEAAEQDPSSTLETNQKTATELDENLETKVTLSFPGKQEVEPADVVFVLDKSGASAQEEIYTQAKDFLAQIHEKAQSDGLNVKVGVVLFNYRGNVKQGLTDVATGYEDILQALNSKVSSGTNMHAGLLAAQQLLDADSAVAARNKHVILISDGATYLYSKNGDYTKAYTRSYGDPKKQIDPSTGKSYPYGRDFQGGIWEYQSREYNLNNAWKKFGDGTNFIFSQAMTSPSKLAEYLDYYRAQEAGGSWSQYDYGRGFFATSTKNPMPIDVNAPANIDVAFMSADDTFQAMVNSGYDMNVYYKNAADFDGRVFLEYLARNSNAGQLNTDFSKLKAKLVDKIAAGSYVEDFIGSRFDFVDDADSLGLTVNGEELKAEKVDDSTFGFGKKADGSYRFLLQHTAGEDEKLVLTLNEAVAPARPAVLEYRARLVDAPTDPGAYDLKVNESATLYPVDGNGIKGTAAEFPVPEVSYTVAEPEPEPEPEPQPQPQPEPQPQPKPGSTDQNPQANKPAANTQVKKSSGIPKTDDDSIVPMFAVLLGAGACAAALILKLRR